MRKLQNPPRDEVASTPTCETPASTRSNISSGHSRSWAKLGKLQGYDEFRDELGFDIVDLEALLDVVKSIAVCRSCLADLICTTGERVGLAVTVKFRCNSCDESVEYNNSRRISTGQGRIHSINARLTYAMRVTGQRFEGCKMLCGLMNFPAPTSKFEHLVRAIMPIVESVAQETMEEARNDAVAQNDGSVDLLWHLMDRGRKEATPL